MKKVIFIALLLLSNMAYGQVEGSIKKSGEMVQSRNPRDVDEKVAIDEVKMRVTFRARISMDTLGEQYYFDNQILEIGEKHNRFYSFYAEDLDSLLWKVRRDDPSVKKRGGAYDNNQNFSSDEYGTYEEVFTHFPSQGVMTAYNGYYNKYYFYEEPVPTFDWEFTGGKDTVIGYECVEAKTSFRGREYRVWFTVDVPYNYGPWKLGGLPGLILKAQDTMGLFKWEAIGIEQPKGAKMYRYDIEAKKSKRKDILRLNDLRWQDQKMLALTNGMKGFNVVTLNETTGEMKEVDFPRLDPIPQLELF